MPNTSRTTYKSTSKSTSKNTSKSTTTTFNTSHSTSTSYTTTYGTSRSTSRTTTYNTYYNTSHTTTYNTEWAVSTSHQTTAQTTTTFNTTYLTTFSQNTTIFTNTNTVVSTAVSSGSVTTSAPVLRSTTFFRPKEVSQTNLMLNLDARVSAGITTWKDQSGNNRHATPTSISSVVPSDRCTALYNFHSDATDLTGNNTGTETDITYSGGNFGQGAVFNGSSSKIELPSGLSDGTTSDADCISFWFNVGAEVTSSTTSNEIMQFAGTSSLTGKIALGSTSGHMSGETFSVTHNVSGVYTYSTTNIPAGWNHAVVQWNSSASKWDIYINATAHTTYTVGTNAQGKFKLKFGNRSSNYYTGSLDQIRIFNKSLSSSEITQLYNENSSTFKKVDIFNDATDGHYNLDGTDSFYMTHFITDQNFTIGGWFYRNSAGGSAGYETLWSQGYSPAVRCQIYGADGSASGNRLYIYLHNGSSSASYDTGIDLPTGEWFHLMKTYDLSAGTVKVYLNSALKKTQSTITGNIYSSGNSDALFRIAKNSSNNTGYINGKISQVRVYDSVLTDEQVIDDYSTHDYLYI